MEIQRFDCSGCGKRVVLQTVLQMAVDVTKTPNHTECIRCGMCVRECPTNAVSFHYGFGEGKDKRGENAAGNK